MDLWFHNAPRSIGYMLRSIFGHRRDVVTAEGVAIGPLESDLDGGTVCRGQKGTLLTVFSSHPLALVLISRLQPLRMTSNSLVGRILQFSDTSF